MTVLSRLKHRKRIVRSMIRVTERVPLFSVGNGDITEAQAVILSQAIGRVKEAVTRLSTDHRDLHSSVSKVGKAIDKVWIRCVLLLSPPYLSLLFIPSSTFPPSPPLPCLPFHLVGPPGWLCPLATQRSEYLFRKGASHYRCL